MGPLLTDYAPIILIAVSAIAFAVFFWRLSNYFGYKARKATFHAPLATTNKSVHTMIPSTITTKKIAIPITTAKKFTRAEKKVMKKVQVYMEQGKVTTAANALESIGLVQDALTILESSNLVNETAQLLMRMKRYDRAGLLYARHNMWSKAVTCFKSADKPLEVARCAREAGELATAAEYYEKAALFKDAAECYTQVGNLEKAISLFKKGGDTDKVLLSLEELFRKTTNQSSINIGEEDKKMIVEFLGAGNSSIFLEKYALSQDFVHEILTRLLARGLNEKASELFQKVSLEETVTRLMSEISYDETASRNLAEVLTSQSQFLWAARVYSQIDSYVDAGDAYEKAGNLEEALMCYEKSGNVEKAQSVKMRLMPEPPPPPLAANDPDPPAFKIVPQIPLPVIKENVQNQMIQVATPEKEENIPPPPTNFSDPIGFDDKVIRQIPINHEEKNEAQKSNDLKNVFYKAAFLESLDNFQKDKLWDIGEATSYASGDVILTYNDEPEGVYIILAGSVNCYRQVGQEKKFVDRMGPGKVFGELWLLAEQSTTVQFVASNRDTKIHIVRRGPFQALLDKDGTIARKIYKRFTMRLLKHLLTPQNSTSNSIAS